MSDTNVEIADIVRLHGETYRQRHGHRLPWQYLQVLIAIARCRTPAMGGHMEVCTSCGFVQAAYNSCRNRHCPKCLGSARWRWTAARECELLPVPYFHVVFTLPHHLAPLALANQRVVYGLLFKAAAQTLSQVAADPQHLGAKIGFLAILHTWGQKLNYHPHVHCVVPGGGLSLDRTRWIPAAPNYFLPVQVLSKVYRAKFLDLLFQAYTAGRIKFPGKLANLSSSVAFKRHLASTKRHDWVVYAKPPFGGPQQVVRYLARYTHRVAISNSRILSLDSGKVTFLYKDYADNNSTKTANLSALVFIRRFLMHVLPPRFTRIRYYGFLANRDRNHNLDLCRQLLGAVPPILDTTHQPSIRSVINDSPDQPTDQAAPDRCPACGIGRLVTASIIARPFLSPDITSTLPATWDTS